MKIKLLVIALLTIFCQALVNAQGGSWEWVKGPQGSINSGTYGTQGVESATNNPPGLYEAANWADRDGNFWIFGGGGPDGNYSDLWKFNPHTNNWTWMKGPGVANDPGNYGTMGIPSINNNPPSRGWGALSWVDHNGNFWLYGGQGGYNGLANYSDLWEYDVANNVWTWMSGFDVVGLTASYGTKGVPSIYNSPGGRNEGTSTWVDKAGDLWFFGGSNYLAFYNDLWRYNISTNQWSWVSGSSGPSVRGVFGTMGVPSTTNLPGARASYTNWKDSAGSFYLFAGFEVFNTGASTASDVWQYNPVTNLWTWVAGENYAASMGNYSGDCVITGSTGPAARYENRTAQFTGCSGTSYFSFGGATDDTFKVTQEMNDLWMFNTQTFQWKLLNGGSGIGSLGNYGTQGIPSTGNLPPARAGHCLWMDNSGNLWLFGGTLDLFGGFSDVWKFIPDPACIGSPLSGGINTQVQQNTLCHGDSTKLSLTGVSNVHISPGVSVSWIDTANAWLFPDSTTTYTITGTTTCATKDTATIKITVISPGKIVYQLADTQVCRGTPTSLSVLNVANVVITPLTGVTRVDSLHFILNPDTTTTYRLTGASTSCGGNDTAIITLPVVGYNPITVTVPDTADCVGDTIILATSGLSNVYVSTYVLFPFIPIDSAHVGVYSQNYGYYTYVLLGQNTCGGMYGDTFSVNWLQHGVLNYQVSKTELCLGDSALLSFSGAYTHPRIIPNTVRWVDSTHIMLHPDTNTVYHLYSNSVCAGLDSAAITIYVMQPGQVNYQLRYPEVCIGNENQLYVYGLSHQKISPPETITYVYGDTLDSYIYLPADTYNITYMITGRSVCGQPDTSDINVQGGIPPSYTVSQSTLCPGSDSAIVSFTGYSHVQFSPTSGVTWLDSNHVLLKPTVSTNYLVTYSACTTTSGTMSIPILVGTLNFTISDSIICPFSHSEIIVSGVTNPVLNPYSSFSYWAQNAVYTQVEPLSSTTYTLTGLNICGGRDTAHFHITVAGENSTSHTTATICAGDTTKILLQGMLDFAINPANNFTWVDSLLDSTRIAFYPDTTTTYIIGANDCYYDRVADTVHVIVESGRPLTYTASDSVICPGGNIYLTVSGVTNPVISPYSAFTDSSTFYYTYLHPSSSTVYVITGQATGTCSANDTAYFHASVKPGPDYALSSSSICAGDSTALQLTGFDSVHVTPSSTVYWQNATTAWLSPDSTTVYTIAGISTCADSFRQVVPVTVTSPVVAVTASSLSICSNDSSHLCATQGFASYRWSTGQTTACIETDTAGTYYCTVTDANGCTAQSPNVVLAVVQVTPVIIIQHGDTLTASTGAVQQWYLNGNPIPGATSNVYVATASGTYSVSVIERNCPTSNSPATPITITGISEIGADNVNVYPNPSTDSWELSVDANLIGSELNIYDAGGKRVYHDIIRMRVTEVSVLSSGVYFMQITAPGVFAVKKLVKL